MRRHPPWPLLFGLIFAAIALIVFAFSSIHGSMAEAASVTATPYVQETAATDIEKMTLADTDLDAALTSPLDAASTTASLGFGDAVVIVPFALLAIVGTSLYVLWRRSAQTRLRDPTLSGSVVGSFAKEIVDGVTHSLLNLCKMALGRVARNPI